MSWIMTPPPQAYAEVLTPAPWDVPLFEDRVTTDVIC